MKSIQIIQNWVRRILIYKIGNRNEQYDIMQHLVSPDR